MPIVEGNKGCVMIWMSLPAHKSLILLQSLRTKAKRVQLSKMRHKIGEGFYSRALDTPYGH